jgi:hypothetical protein
VSVTKETAADGVISKPARYVSAKQAREAEDAKARAEAMLKWERPVIDEVKK